MVTLPSSFTNNLLSMFGLHYVASLQYNQYALPTNRATMWLSCAEQGEQTMVLQKHIALKFSFTFSPSPFVFPPPKPHVMIATF